MKHSTFTRLTWAAIGLCYIVVVLGAYVRLSDAGLGCPDWPGCYGQVIVPSEEAEVLAANEAYPERPVEAGKAWKEMIHRFAAGILLLIVFALTVAAWRGRDCRWTPKRVPYLLLPLILFQAALGMWTVTLLLKPIIVSSHLMGGMTTLALLFLMALGLCWQPTIKIGRKLQVFAAICLVVLIGQIFLGAWTSSNYAALACYDFPTCQGAWVPELNVTEAFTMWRGLGVNYEYGVLDNTARVTVHFIHRLGAIVTSALILLLVASLLRRAPVLALCVFAALCTQVLIGISTVIFNFPLPVAAAHNAGAAALLLSLVAVNYAAWKYWD